MKTLRQVADNAKTTDELVAYVVKNPKVWNEALKDLPLVRRMLDGLVRYHRNKDRSDFRKNLGDTAEDRQKRTAGRSRSEQRFRESVWHWPIYGGTLTLSRCRRHNLLWSKDQRNRLAEDNRLAARFEEAVANLLPDDRRTVEECLSLDDVVQAYRSVYQVTEEPTLVREDNPEPELV